MSAKILIIGIDGGTWTIFDPFIDNGVMPNLKSLRDGGTSGLLASTRPPTTAPAWATLMTGVHPGKHRVLGFESFDCTQEKVHLTNSRSIVVETMWSYLGRHGKKVACLNMPMTYPPFEVNGVMVSGFGCPSPNAPFSWPADLKHEVLEAIPDYELLMGWKLKDEQPSDSNLKFVIDKAIRCYKAEKKLYDLITDRYGWDFLLLQTHEIDRFLHSFARMVQPTVWDNGRPHPEIIRFFQHLDDTIGHLAGRLDRQKDITVVVSDHGHGMQCSIVKPNKLLQEWGYLDTRFRINRILYRLRKDIHNLRRSSRASKAGGMDIADKLKINWPKTRAYVAHVNHHGFLFINLKGRQPHGIVEPGREYDELLEELRTRFREAVDPASGQPIYREVATPSEFYGVTPEEHAHFGDLILIPQDHYWHQRTLRGDHFLEQAGENAGFHHPQGMMLFQGRNIKSDRRLNADIADVTPTLYAALDIPLPGNMDGRVLNELFVEPTKIRTSEAAPIDTSARDSHLTKDEEQMIADRLSNMGYLQ